MSCQKETPQTPKKRRFGACRRLNPVFTKLCVIGNFLSRVVNDAPHRRPCVCFAYARGTNGRIMRAVSAATNGSNARFWWQLSFTLRDDHAASILNFGKSVLCLRPPAGVFLWGATPVSLGKTKEMGWQNDCRGFRPCNRFIRACALIILPRAALRRTMRPGAAWPVRGCRWRT